MKRIVKTVSEMKYLTQKKLSQIIDIEHKLLNILVSSNIVNLRDLRKFDHGGYGFRWVTGDGNVSHLLLVKLEGRKVFPSKKENIGRENYYFRYLSHSEIIEFAKSLPEFLENFIKVLEDFKTQYENINIPEIIIKS